jgi:uncharacterized phage-like protein YoqJ
MESKEKNRARSVAFTGHRLISRADMPSMRKRLMAAIRRAYEEGYRVFMSGMAYGFDLMAAECVIELKTECPDIKLMAVIPYRGQCERWNKTSQEHYWKLLGQTDEQTILREDYHPSCFLSRDRYLVEHASKLIAYFNGVPKGGTFYTIKEARKMRLPVENIYP